LTVRYKVMEYQGYGYAILDTDTNKYVRGKQGMIVIHVLKESAKHNAKLLNRAK